MAEMRFRAYPFLLLVVVLLALPAVAVAGPQPIKKPDAPTKATTPPARTPSSSSSSSPSSSSPSSSSSSSTANQTPIQKPTTPKNATGTAGTSTGNSSKSATVKTTPPKVVVVDVVGRDQRSAEITRPLVTAPKVTVPDPTPLAVVAAGDRVRVHSAPTPAWKLALLALLAAAEAFLVVRLVRYRPGTLSPAS